MASLLARASAARPLRGAVLALAGTGLALVLTACGMGQAERVGSDQPAGATSPSSGPTSSGGRSTPSGLPATPEPATPAATGTPPGDATAAGSLVTLHRSGGIAGFMDTLAIAPSGLATLHRKGGASSSCRVDVRTMATITAAVRDIRALPAGGFPPSPRALPGGPGPTASPIPDAVTTTLTVATTTATARQLADPAAPTPWRALYAATTEVFRAALSPAAGSSGGCMPR